MVGMGRSRKGIAAPIPALGDRVSQGMLGIRYFQRDTFFRLQLHAMPENILFLQQWLAHSVCFPLIRLSNVEVRRKFLYSEPESLQIPSLMVSFGEQMGLIQSCVFKGPQLLPSEMITKGVRADALHRGRYPLLSVVPNFRENRASSESGLLRH